MEELGFQRKGNVRPTCRLNIALYGRPEPGAKGGSVLNRSYRKSAVAVLPLVAPAAPHLVIQSSSSLRVSMTF